MTSPTDPAAGSPASPPSALEVSALEVIDVSGEGGAAAGPVAVVEALRHAAREIGLWRGTRLLMSANQTEGFDCPGCAWPDPKERAAFEFCENGAKAVAAEGTRRRVTPRLLGGFSLEELRRKSDEWLESQGRITHPVIKRAGSDRYEAIGWDEANARIGEVLRGLESADQAAFYTSGRTSNEAAFLLQLFARRFGTNNLPDCSNLCHESSGYGLSRVIGVGKGTVTLECFERADAIFVIGQNPGTNHPRMLSALEKAALNGAKIVSVNPLKEVGLVRFKNPQKMRGMLGRGTELASLHLPVRINGDVALLTGIIKAVLAEEARRPGEVLDAEFIAERTSGFEAMAESVEATEWDAIEAGCGIARAEIEAAARIYWQAERVIICWAMGLTQHKNGVANVQQVVNLLLLRGNIGRPGAGACPVRGHSNVQGDRTVGITARPKPAFLERLGAAFGFEPPAEPGVDAVEVIEAMEEGRVRALLCMGGNFLNASPDTERTALALQRTDLTVQVSTKLNRSHLVVGNEAIILPCLGRTERDETSAGAQFVSVENSMGIVHRSRGRMTPASETLHSEPRIVCDIAAATLGSAPVEAGDAGSIDWASMALNYDRVRDAIERVVPGFDGYNERVRAPGGFSLPNGAREGRFATSDGKAQFTVHGLPRHDLRAGELLMMTIRSHDQYNTTIYSQDDRYRGIRGSRRVVFLSPADIEAQGLHSRQRVDLISHFEGTERVAEDFQVVPYDLPEGSAATYFPETNVLVPLGSRADGSNTPTSKSVVITVRPR